MAKTKHKILISLLLLIVFCLPLSACRVYVTTGFDFTVKAPTSLPTPALSAPIGKTGMLEWQQVTRADYYRLEINGEKIETNYTFYDLYSGVDFAKPKSGIFNIKLTAASRNTLKYDPSEPLVLTHKAITVQLDLPYISLAENNIITWQTDGNETQSQVSVNNIIVTTANNTLDLNTVKNADTYNIAITAKGDGVYFSDSQPSELIYKKGEKKLKLPSPKNAHMEGIALTFDTVQNATSYVVSDVLNNQFQINDNVLDLTNLSMIQSVYARDNSGAYLPSDKVTNIKYFAEGDGLSQQTEFKINDYNEIRYIEFYERQDIKRFYGLNADITFEQIEFEEVEEATNFFSVGSFGGSLNGNGYAFDGLKANSKSGYYSLFDTITSTGRIKNLTIKNANIRTWRGIAGDQKPHPMGSSIALVTNKNYGTIEDIKIADCTLISTRDDVSTIASTNYGYIKNIEVSNVTMSSGEGTLGAEAAGIATKNLGTIEKATILSSTKITALKNLAGITALNIGIITNCTNNASLTATTDNNEVGGIASWNEGQIKFCANNAKIFGKQFAGGITGKNGGHISNCTNSGAVSGTNCVGGISGTTENFANIDGVVNGIINCTNIGTISGITNYGDIVGLDYDNQSP